MLDKKMSKIDWNQKTAKDIKNLVRGLNPIMGAYTIYNNKKIKFWKVQTLSIEEILELLLKNDSFNAEDLRNRIESIENGTVLYSNDKVGLYIKAKEGYISVLEIQGENAKKLEIKEFLRGNNISTGSIFE